MWTHIVQTVLHIIYDVVKKNYSNGNPDSDKVEYSWEGAFNSLCNILFFKLCKGHAGAYFFSLRYFTCL